MLRITLYVNPNQTDKASKNVYFKHGDKFYRTGVTIGRLSDLNIEAYRQHIRTSINNILRNSISDKYVIENKGLVYTNSAVMLDDL